MNINEVETFSKVRITTPEEVFEGLFLPQEGKSVVLKLDSGYNIGILPESIKDIEVIGPRKEPSEAKPFVPEQNDLPIVRILHTGGTIASKVDYETGGVVGKFKPEELIALFPELSTLAQVQAEFLGNMSSDDFRFSHFNKVAQAAHRAAKEGVDRIIVTSGTDFLHYLSAALSFLLKDVPVGVLVVGSQRSSDRGSSDAAVNLMCATQFLVQSHFQGVGICMHRSSSDSGCDILSGVNARKMHSSARATFKPINTTALATVQYPSMTMDLHQMLSLCEGDVPEKIPLLQEDLKIGIISSKPNMFAEELAPYARYDGLILAGSGLGHFPISATDDTTQEHESINKALKELAQKIPVAMSVQTIYGRVNMNVYSPGRLLRSYGVLGHQSSMITETAYIKLAYLLSTNKEKVRELFDKDLLGELPKTDLGDFQ
ncbi:MAG: Glu-tRNA(Gln) amidotransferase subunit GatD [Nanoarchaeota archaeon]|nr:Glu-tRNA(Gln) amidotransferase subunit GatD [Nanoarchaeota archaeon]